MTLTYRLQFAGNNILRPTAAVTDVMDRWLERHAPALYSHPGWDTHGIDHLPLPPKPKQRCPRLNVLDWPVGCSRWASFYCLVGSKAFAAIKEAVDPLAPTSGEFSIETVDANGTGTDVIRVPMYVGDVRPVFCSDYAAEKEQELFLLTLVDRRYWGWQRELSYDFAACDSWLTLLQNLYTAAYGGTLPALTTDIESEYGEPWWLRWSRPGTPLPLLLDAVAAQLGRRFVFRPTTATENVELRTAAEALTYDQLRWDADGTKTVAGGHDLSTTNLPGNTPAGWAVGFAGDVQAIETGTLADLAIAEYGDITGVAGQSVWLRADKRADESSNSLAQLMATQWYLWALSPTDATLRGIIAGDYSNPSGCEDRVEWRYLPPDTDRRTVYQPGTTPTDTPPGGLDIVRDRVLTTVVPIDRADRNLYGDRPPPGYTYSVKITAVSGDAMSAVIRVVDPGCGTESGSGGGSGAATEEVVDGPVLGYAPGGLVLYRDPLAVRPGVGDVGTAVPDPIVPNRWIFQGAAGGGTDDNGAGSGECASDAWLKWIRADPLPCWTLYNRGGFGRCSCFPLEDYADPTEGLVLQWDTVLMRWLGVRDNGETDAMTETCCGCGSAQLEIIAGGIPGRKARLYLGGVHVSCQDGESGSGSGGEQATTFSEMLEEYCTGTLPDGRRYLLFQGSSADACSGTEDDCTNEYNIMVVCGAECDPPVCGCIGCHNFASPLVWYRLPVSGFADAHYNGDWVWVQTAECTWAAACRGATSTLEFDGYTDPENPVWRLTHDGSVYEHVPEYEDCVAVMVLAKVSGDDGPESISLTPFAPQNPQFVSNCCPDPPDTLYATSEAYGVTVAITRIPGPGAATWETPGAPASCDGPPPTFSATLIKDEDLCTYLVSFHATCCGGTAAGYYYPLSREPFLLSVPVTNSDPQCEGTDTVTISETPP